MANVNFNVFDSLSKSPYKEKVRQKEAELEYLSRMQQREEKEAAEQVKYSEHGNRVKEVELEARKGIQEGVKAANGDMKTFLLMGGYSKIRDYRNAVMKSDALKTAQKNAVYMEQIRKDLAANKMHERAYINGQLVTMNDQIAMFKNGDLDEIVYTQAATTPKFNPKDFRKMYNPLSPNVSTQVTAEEAIEIGALKNGVSKDIMAQHLEPFIEDGYIKQTYWGIRDGDNWKSDSIKLQNASKNTKTRSSKPVDIDDANEFMRLVSAEKSSTNKCYWGTDEKVEEVYVINVGSTSKKARDLSTKIFGVGIDKDGEYTTGIKSDIGGTSMATGKKINFDGHAYEVVSLGNDISVVQSFKYDENGNIATDAKGEYISGKNQMYIQATIFLEDDAYDNFLQKNEITNEKKQIGKIYNKVDYEGVSGRTLKIGLPIMTDSENLDLRTREALEILNVGEAVETFKNEPKYIKGVMGDLIEENDPREAQKIKFFVNARNILQSRSENLNKSDRELNNMVIQYYLQNYK
jgi:hypothetical protein